MEKYVNTNSKYIKMGTQENMLLNYLKEHDGITNLEAIMKLGIMQCPARIWGLKRRGVNIKTRRKQVIDRYGETKRIVEYYLAEEEGEKAV